MVKAKKTQIPPARALARRAELQPEAVRTEEGQEKSDRRRRLPRQQ